MKKVYKLYVILLILVYYSSCIKDKGTIVVKGCDPPVQVSYQQHIQPIFNTYCVSGCHAGSTPSGGLNLESSVSYAELMQAGSGYVDTLNSNNSLLHWQMNAASNIMPPSGKLDQCTLDLIDKWMQQKAKNN